MTPTLTPFTHDDFLVAVDDLARQIVGDDWRPNLLVGIGRGGLVPAVFLSHASGLPMLSVDASTPIPAFNTGLIEALAERSRTGERMVFVEDINDSGQTIAALRSDLARAGVVADAVRFAVLVDNRVSAERVDYRWRTIDRTVTKDWFVFPWEAVAPTAQVLVDAAKVPDRIA